MKPLFVVFGFLAVLSLAFVFYLTLATGSPAATPSVEAASPFESRSQPRAAGNDGESRARLERLERLVEALASRVDELESAPRRSDVADVPDPGAAIEALSPADYLRRYVASFADTPEGDEFCRMVVQSHVDELSADVSELVRSPSAIVALRCRLAAMLRLPKFAARAHVVDALVSALMDREHSEMPPAALASLCSIGGPSVLARLEAVVGSLELEELRRAVYSAILREAGDGHDAVIARLFAAARGDADRIHLLSLLTGVDPERMLDVIRDATRFDTGVRLQAAVRIGDLRTEAALAYIDEWLEFEREERVRAALRSSRSEASQIPGWHAMQALGPPDANPGDDDARAWAAKSPEMGVQWLELAYAPARRISGVRIHEVCTAGGVTKVIGFDSGGAPRELWSGVDPTATPGPFRLDFPATDFAVQRLRLVIDTDRRRGWEEIDAVEIVGPDGAAWAVRASASSSYGGS